MLKKGCDGVKAIVFNQIVFKGLNHYLESLDYNNTICACTFTYVVPHLYMCLHIYICHSTFIYVPPHLYM